MQELNAKKFAASREPKAMLLLVIIFRAVCSAFGTPFCKLQPINLLTGSFRHQPHGQPHQLHNPNYQPHDQPSARKHHMLRSMLAGKKEEPRTLGSPEQVHSCPYDED